MPCREKAFCNGFDARRARAAGGNMAELSLPRELSPGVWQTDVLVIGAGATGTGIARDLALRGVSCLVAEWRDVAAGASGGNHGLLHSGARYVARDTEAAAECREEGALVKQLAPHCVEDCGGLFVAVEGDDLSYADAFPAYCAQAGIIPQEVDPQEARALEPALSPKVVRAYAVPDASVDPFRLCLDNMAHAASLAGSVILPHVRVTGLDVKKHAITTVHAVHSVRGAIRIQAKQVVNAAGAWAAELVTMVGAALPMLFSKGTLLVTHDRLAKRVINRLRPPGNGDILVPGGTVSVLGTTSVHLTDLSHIQSTVAEEEENLREAIAMLPSLGKERFIRAYAGVRPLVGSGEDARSVSRNYTLLRHDKRKEGGLENMVTITGGKLTTYRLMAEKTTDVVCERLGVTAPCRTRTEPLPSVSASSWTEPGHSAKAWVTCHEPSNPVLCECEMVQADTVKEIVASLPEKDQSVLHSLGLRSRVGKGPCQGAFCSIRVTAALYDGGVFKSREGISQLVSFLRSRFKGQKPILWGTQLAQSELAEALHCGLFSLEREASKEVDHD